MIVAYFSLERSILDLDHVKQADNYIKAAIITDTYQCRQQGQIVGPQALRAEPLLRYLMYHMGLTAAVWFFLIIKKGFCDHICMGGAKPQVLIVISLLYSIFLYFNQLKYLMGIQTYTSTLKYLTNS